MESSSNTSESLSQSTQSLNSSQYDAQTFDEWTILSEEDTTEHTNEDNIEDNPNISQILNEETKQSDENQLNDSEMADEDKENKDTNQLESHSSDIDVIEDESSDDEASTVSLCSSSVVSQMSNLSFLRDQYLLQSHLLSPDYINEDLSESSSLNYRELSTEVELKRGVRAYVHTPNTGLNGKLNLILILSVSTVIGLGIGNFIGWSNHWKQQKQLSMGQVMKLKQLQDELVVCMQNQANTWNETPQLVGQNAKVCYSNSDYWKEKFEKLFSENKGLMELFEKTQKHYHLKGNHDNIITDKECDNKSANDEFHNLKLGLLVKQMEHLQLLKTLEEVKYKGLQSEKRVQDLEVENSELKMKLVEEEEDDEMIVKSWGNRVELLENENKELRSRIVDDEEEDLVVLQNLNDRIAELQTENNELKAAIFQLEAQVVHIGHNPTTSSPIDEEYSLPRNTKSNNKIPVKLDLLRQKINQMVLENDELKSTIARLRWSSGSSVTHEPDLTPDEEEVESALDLSVLEEQMNSLKDMLMTEQNESKKWKQLYEEMKGKNEDILQNGNNDNNNKKEFDERVVYDWIWNSTKIFKEALVSGSSVVGDRLKSMFDQISKSESIIPNEIYNGINATQSILSDLNQRLQNKWQKLQHLKSSFGNQKISLKMAKLLENTLRKLQDAGEKLINKEKTLKSRVEHFSGRISKLIENLDNKWNDLLNKWTERYSKQNIYEASEDETKEKIIPNTNWFFERANSRRVQQTEKVEPNKHSKDVENSRTLQSEDEDSDSDNQENWYLKKGKKSRVNFDDIDSEKSKARKIKLKGSQQFSNKVHYSSANSKQR